MRKKAEAKMNIFQKVHSWLKPCIAIATVITLILASLWLLDSMTTDSVPVKIRALWVAYVWTAVTLYWSVRIIYWGVKDFSKRRYDEKES